MIRGSKHSEEAKIKNRLSHLGKKIIFKNPIERGINISRAKRGITTRKGYYLSEGHKKKISEANKGRRPYIITEKTRKKMSESQKGNKNPAWIDGRSRDKSYYKRLRRIKKLKIEGRGYHTFAEWELLKAQYNWICPACKKPEPEIKLSEDHIIPVSKGGSNNIENIQPLCRICNSKKHTKIILYDNKNLLKATKPIGDEENPNL